MSRVGPLPHPRLHSNGSAGVLRTAGRVVQLKGPPSNAPRSGGCRGRVRQWSSASRRRLLKTAAAIDWDLLADTWGGGWLFVTLTYRDDPGPARCKRDLTSNFSRWAGRSVRPAVGCSPFPPGLGPCPPTPKRQALRPLSIRGIRFLAVYLRAKARWSRTRAHFVATSSSRAETDQARRPRHRGS